MRQLTICRNATATLLTCAIGEELWSVVDRHCEFKQGTLYCAIRTASRNFRSKGSPDRADQLLKPEEC